MVTRFRPTPNGDMHLGHVWVVMNNWWAARASGGRMVMIVDDICWQLQFCGNQCVPIDQSVDRMLEDMEWLGMSPDEVIWSSFNAESHAEANKRSGLNIPLIGTAGDRTYVSTLVREPFVVWDSGCLGDVAYNPWFVLIRAVDDHDAGVTDFYRGQDLFSEIQLYDFIARRCGYNPPNQAYLPTVKRDASTHKESKSIGAISVRNLRDAGYTPGEVKRTLRACVRNSIRSGLRDVVIPEGILELEKHGTLRYNWVEDNWTTAGESQGLNEDIVGKEAFEAGTAFTKMMIDRVDRAER